MPVSKAWLSLPAQGQCATLGNQFIPLQLGVLSEERGCWLQGDPRRLWRLAQPAAGTQFRSDSSVVASDQPQACGRDKGLSPVVVEAESRFPAPL